jgi:hypothetical protein
MAYSTSFRFSRLVIIESLATDDLAAGAAARLVEALGSRGSKEILDPLVIQATGRDDVLRELSAIEQRVRTKGEGPIVHIEAHGDKTGMVLASGELLPWGDLAAALRPINEATQFNLLLVLALCSGWHFCRALMPTDAAPAWGVIGPPEPVWSSELHDATVELYTELASKADLRAAVARMNRDAPMSAWEYRALPAEIMFAAVFRRYAIEFCSDEQVRSRSIAISHLALRESGLDLRAAFAVRPKAVDALRDVRAQFHGLRRRHFMLDKFPRNEERFPITFEDAMAAPALGT